MEEFPSNARRIPKIAPVAPEKTEKKIERVTTGDVVRRKPSLSRRFVNTFLKGDAKNAWYFVVGDVLVPAAKDMIADAVTQGFERMIFGDVRSRPRRGFSSGAPSHISYNRYTAPTQRNNAPREYRPEPRMSRRTPINFEDIILATRVEAEEVLELMHNLVEKYNSVTVSDLYDMIGTTGEYTDEKWGWTDMRNVDIVRVRDGYLLNLPKPEPLD